MSSIHDICVIGHPSKLGGADTELDHQIDCWLQMGLKVHICHTGGLDANLRAMDLESRGCIYHAPRDWASLEGLDCISFCNGEFLAQLPEIRKYARTISWVNCMTWAFDREIEMQGRGLIDFHLYQTQHAFDRIRPKLEHLGGYRPLFITPYFRAADFPYHKDRPRDRFRFGRISRADADKYNARQMWIYETMTAPVLKEGIMLGWNEQIGNKIGAAPSYVRQLQEGAMAQQEFYRFCDAIIMTTDTFENLPRVGFEAMSSGAVLVVDRRGGWKLLVEDGVTGWLCDDDREFVYKASRTAFEHRERNEMAARGRKKLEANWGLEAAMVSWSRVFETWRRFDRVAAQAG